MSETTATALEALLRDYRHLEARGDDDVINEFRDGLVGDVLAERERLTVALRECIAAMERLDAAMLAQVPPQYCASVSVSWGLLRTAAAKARAALGE